MHWLVSNTSGHFRLSFGNCAALTVACFGFVSSKLRSCIAACLLTVLTDCGPLPSVLRRGQRPCWRWVSVCPQVASGLNCLGVGLIVTILYDPRSFTYRLSADFLATAAILMFSSDVQKLLQNCFQNGREDVEHVSFMDQLIVGVLKWATPLFR